VLSVTYTPLPKSSLALTLVVINLSRYNQKFNATERAISGNYTDLFTGKETKLTANLKLDLAPWEYKVYYK
jgi:hypothetical protein